MLYRYHCEYFGRKNVSRDNRASPGTVVSVLADETWTFLPTPKTARNSLLNYFVEVHTTVVWQKIVLTDMVL